MLEICEIPLIFPKGKRVHPSMGSIFHGALMERIAPEAAAVFHTQHMRPYSQAVFWDPVKKRAVWRLGFLEEGAAAAILPVLEELDHLDLRQQGYAVRLGGMRCQSFSLEEDFHTAEDVPVGVTIRFLTTTSFKRDGSYVLFPEAGLLYQSILHRWPLLSDMPLEDGIHRILDYYTIVQDYDLHTELFHLEGHSVKGFSGTVTLRFGGNARLRSFASLLLYCGSAAGFGIKTALGMGSAEVQFIHKGNHVSRRRRG